MASRRDFLTAAAMGVAAKAVSATPGYVGHGSTSSDRKIRIGIVGGGFGCVFCNMFWHIAAGGERANWFGEKGTFYMTREGIHGVIWDGRNSKPEEVTLPEYWNTDRLPPAMRHESGHGGSHTFLTAEFVNALFEDREPAIDVYESLAMTVPGIVSHQSALRNGEQMEVPQLDPAT